MHNKGSKCDKPISAEESLHSTRKTRQLFLLLPSFYVVAILSILFAYFLSKPGNPLISYVLVFAFGYILADVGYSIACHYLKLDGGQKIGKYHFHHSIHGLLAMIFSFVVFLFFGAEVAGLVFFWGVGVITQYIFNHKKLVFITES